MFTDIIPDMLTNINQPPEKKETPPINLSRYTDRLFLILLGDYQMRLREKTLRPDGSFYGSNKRYQNALGASCRTIIRGKKQLAQAGKIRFRIHQGRGKSTDYWILDNVEKKAAEKAVRPDTIPYHEAQKMIDCAKQFGSPYALQIYLERGYTASDIRQVLGLA